MTLDWPATRVAVLGFGDDGFAAADNLLHLGARVTVLDVAEPDDDAGRERVQLLDVLGAGFRWGSGLDIEVDLVVVTSARMADVAAVAPVPVWSDVELAWRLRGADAAPWLVVAGGDPELTVRMLASMLAAAGIPSDAVGTGVRPVVEAVMDPAPYAVFAVGVSDDALPWTTSPAAESAAVLTADVPAAGQIYEGVSGVCVYNVEDRGTEDFVRDAEVVEGARAVGFTRGVPGLGMVGVIDGLLVDRAFIADRQHSAAELCAVADLPDDAPATIAAALAAAALARSRGVEPRAVRDGVRALGT